MIVKNVFVNVTTFNAYFMLQLRIVAIITVASYVALNFARFNTLPYLHLMF